MDFFEKLGETVTFVGKEAVDKTKAFAEMASLKNQIHSCDEVIKKNYSEIGKVYYENFGDTPEDLFARQCNNINNAEKAKAVLEEKLKQIKEDK